jgi:mannose-1-phosphate guanylyltransferase
MVGLGTTDPNRIRIYNMRVVIFAEEVGAKLWPVTSDELPKALLPVYSESTLLEETIGRFFSIAEQRGENILIVTLEKAMEALTIQKTLQIYNIPNSNVITLPTCKGSAWTMWEATRYLIDIMNIPPSEPVIFTVSDQFVHPKELAVFHLTNAVSRGITHPDQCVAVTLTPGGPAPDMNYFYGDWQKAVTVGTPFEYETGTPNTPGMISTLGVPIEDYQTMPDIGTAEELVSNNWMWDLNTYYGKLELFDHYLQEALSVKVSQRMCWESLGTVSFSSVIPSIIRDRKMFAAWIPSLSWSVLDNWVSIRHLMYDSKLFVPPTHSEVHSVRSTGNLVFKPPGKTVALYGISDLIIVDVGDKLLIGTPEGLHEYF